MPGHALDGGAPRVVRTLVAVVLTLWCVLQAATLVGYAVRGGGADLALAFWYAGIFTIALGVAAVLAWRWRARADHVWLRLPDEAPGAPDDPAGAEAQPRARHTGLSGTTQAPRRW